MRSRSAHSLTLVRYCRIHCVGRGYAPFSSAHSFGIPSGESGGDDGVAAFASRPVLRLVLSFCLYVHCSLFIRAIADRAAAFSIYHGSFSRLVSSRAFLVHPCRSKQEAAAFSICPVSPLASCLAPSNPPPRCPLPHSLRSSSLIRLAPRPVLRLAARLVFMPSCSSSRSSFRPVLPDVPHGFPPVLRSRRFVQLILPFSPIPCRPLVAS